MNKQIQKIKLLKKWILPIVIIFCINLVVGFCAAQVFILTIFRGNLFWATIAAAVTLPGILLQPWFLLFFFLPGGLLWALLPTTLITAILYFRLERLHYLERPKNWIRHIRIRSVICVGVILLLFIVGIAYARYVDYFEQSYDTPRLIERTQTNPDFQYKNDHYYPLRSFIDSEWLWQAEMPQSSLHILVLALRLNPIDTNQIPHSFMDMPPYWWKPSASSDTQTYATKEFPAHGRGADGLHVFLTWHSKTQQLHMWVKDNF